VVGIATETSNAIESNIETAKIPALWQQYFSDSIESQIPDVVESSPVLGVYWNYAGDGEKTYKLLAGRQVSQLGELPSALVGVEVPESDYLVFSDEGEMPKIIFSIWESVREYFLSTKQYRRKYTCDFESYETEGGTKVDIFIAIEEIS